MQRTTSARTWREVPLSSYAILVSLLALHIGWRAQQPLVGATLRALAPPPTTDVLRIAAGGDEVSLAKGLMLNLQAYDTQPGLSLPLATLDYGRVVAWLQRCLALDPRAQYPLLAAARLYAEVPDVERSRQMLDFVHAAFATDPARRWPWLAHAVYLAQHRLHDRALALKYARTLARTAEPAIPHWAQQMEVFVLANMGEVDAAKVLLGGLLASGKITDPHEQRLLSQRLHELEGHATQ